VGDTGTVNDVSNGEMVADTGTVSDVSNDELLGDTGTVNNASFEAIEVDPKFTVAEELKYQQRYEEGYDLPDPRYEEWLRINHPEAASRSIFTLSSPNLTSSHLAFEAGKISPVQLSNSSTSVSVSNDSETTMPTPQPVFTIEEQSKYLEKKAMIYLILAMRSCSA